MKTERPHVTFKAFMELVKDFEPAILLLVVTWFQMEDDDAIAALDQWISHAETLPDSDGKKDYVDGFKHIRAAWQKITVPERRFLRAKLNDPANVLAYLPMHKMVDAMMVLLPKEQRLEVIRDLAEKNPEAFLKAWEEHKKGEE